MGRSRADERLYWDQGAEQAVLGAAMANSSALALICRDLRPEAFYRDHEADIMRAILTVHGDGRTVDPVTVAAELGADTDQKAYLHTCVEFVPSVTAAAEYVAAVKGNARRRHWSREARRALEELAQGNGDGELRFHEIITKALEAEPGGPGHARPRLVRLSDVDAEEVAPLWGGWLYLSKIALLIGDPGMAKTMLALHIAACVTTGAPFPDGTRPPIGDVVILTAEDGLADTIRPRLDRAGADVSRVWALQAMRSDDGERTFRLADDVPALEDVVREKRARLVIIDPLDGYLAGVDAHRNSEVRGVLAPVAAMLERTCAAGLFVHHLNKDAGTVNALYRAGGSLAYVAAARSVFGVAADPEDEERRVLVSVKLNLAAKPEGLGYHVTDGGIQWDGLPVTVDSSTAFACRPKRGDSDKLTEARQYILHMLADGRPITQSIIEEDASAAGITTATLRKAKTALAKEGRVLSKRDGFGPGGTWSWQLAPEPCQP